MFNQLTSLTRVDFRPQHGQPRMSRVVMHLAIALVTYNLLVRLAQVREQELSGIAM